jgi:Protein of unknown function (DUF2938)
MNANEMMSLGVIGAGATAATDIWTLVRKRLLGVALPNYRFVGRWMAHLARGRLRHDAIARAAPIRGEAVIGWIAHYAIGIGFACFMPLFGGSEWIAQPTLAPALLVGVATVAAPFFVMQPAMGSGYAASRTPQPNAARIHSLVMHVMFGLGLYITARIL